MTWLLALVAGFVISVVTTPVGVSGAVFLLPVQLSVLGVPNPAVTPTNLLFNVVSGPGALLRYRRRGSLASPLTGCCWPARCPAWCSARSCGSTRCPALPCSG